MSKILSRRRWEPASYELGDPEGGEPFVITMELKRLPFAEANALLVANLEAIGALNSADDAGPDRDEDKLSVSEKMAIITSQVHAAQRFCEALKPEFMATLWRDWIRNVGGIEDEAGPVTTGEELSAFADQKMVLWLLTTLQAKASLTRTEGKAYSSPSTSGLEGQTSPDGNGACPAPSTEPADGSTTATATPN